ncbi:protein-disulfide reductase DsbD, partial [Salinisphaera sp. SWV1]|uniref:protein-disulfide reductase DsbD n=1 Tax=Salinisphaera sp. SWV1 TaxID=3454139 RepID=UPI003F87694F
MRALLVAAILLTGLATHTARADNSPLPAAQAFSPQLTQPGPHRLVVSWRIADGYYLYRHALAFHLADGGDARLGTPQIPPGNRHRDPYFGAVETYRHRLQVSIPVMGTPPGGARLVVKYQGCADAGLCYPPQQNTLALPARASGSTSPGPSGATDDDLASGHSGVAIAAGLGRTGLWYTVGLFFVLGLGLAFTPCILPMIPLVAGMLGTRDHSRRRAAALSGAYVVAMAVAYALSGLIAGYFGTNLQALLQRPSVLLPFAAVFFVLAAASFGWFSFHVPVRMQSRLAGPGRPARGVAGAASLGFLAALIAGPCLAPPLAGALLYISSSGDLLTGALALFALGLGIGAPLIALAVFGVGVLPRSGPWMGEVRVLFGVLLVGVGVWLATRLASPGQALAAWGALALVYGAYLSTRATPSIPATVLKRIVVGVLVGYAALAGAGHAIGGGRAMAPLAGPATP